MASVDSIISLLATDSLSLEEKLELMQTGRDQPMFSFAGLLHVPFENHCICTEENARIDICDALAEVTNALKASLI